MAVHVMFIGNKFIYNEALRRYLLRQVQKECDFVEEITYYKENDTKIFLELQKKLQTSQSLIIFATKNNFSTVGKLLCTATEDIQVLQEGMLIPQKASLYTQGSYLLSYEEHTVNVLQIEENKKMPKILLPIKTTKAVVHVMEEEKEVLETILPPIAQTYEVSFEITTQVTGWQRIDIFSNRYGDISNFINAVKKLLPKQLIASENVIEYIIARLASHGKKLTFAESCTGGLLSYYFTKHNGASKILDGALVTYSNTLKENWLAVSTQTLENFGAVSGQTVEEMSEGALNVSNADYAIAVSGIAGDTGGTEQKPVGTVYIGVRSKDAHEYKHLFFQGDRNFVQEQSVLYAIKMLLLIDKEIFF